LFPEHAPTEVRAAAKDNADTSDLLLLHHMFSSIDFFFSSVAKNGNRAAP
jgi:hypothetical protein